MKTSVKTCFKCGKEKSLDEFYTHPMMKDGILQVQGVHMPGCPFEQAETY